MTAQNPTSKRGGGTATSPTEGGAMDGFTFRASNGEWYAVNAAGEQSPSFRTASEAARYLGGQR